ncbi:MAG: hypothetical protein MJ180_02880 [Candidatus Gastranaerophilales bacterium]|nr:hypothetical protein [Candidatus Gastranaerophilales bacterium]
MANGVLNVHDTMLTNLYYGNGGSDNLSKKVGPWTWSKDFGSSVVPYATPVNIKGSSDCNIDIGSLTNVTTGCSCISQPLLPIASECGGLGNIFGFSSCCGFGWGGMPAGYYTRVGQAYDKTEALNIYDSSSWGTIISGSLKNNLIDMLSTPSGTVQTFGLASELFKGGCGLLSSAWNGIKSFFA